MSSAAAGSLGSVRNDQRQMPVGIQHRRRRKGPGDPRPHKVLNVRLLREHHAIELLPSHDLQQSALTGAAGVRIGRVRISRLAHGAICSTGLENAAQYCNVPAFSPAKAALQGAMRLPRRPARAYFFPAFSRCRWTSATFHM